MEDHRELYIKEASLISSTSSDSEKYEELFEILNEVSNFSCR